jgi:subtilisin family serine protease
MSGTSMASPNVANLAAKLIARDPTLTPEEVVGLIIDGADDMGKNGKTMLVINPKRSLDLLKERHHTSP